MSGGKMKVRRIGLGSAIKTGCLVSAIAGFFAGLCLGILFAFFSSFVASAVSGRDPGFGAGAIVTLPVFFGLVFGMAGGVISFFGALVFNISAGMSGGIELEIDAADTPERTEPSGFVSPPDTPVKKIRRVWKQPFAGLAARRGGAGMRW